MDSHPDRFFAALAHSTRLRCLLLLHVHGESCVCDLTEAIGESQPHVSRHLAQLRRSGWVQDRREGIWIHYRIHPQLPAWTRKILDATLQAAADTPPYPEDARALIRIRSRGLRGRCA